MSKTVLVIDDDANLQAVLEIALSKAGYNVELAANGQEGLERLETLHPNVVLSDVMMPEMDGVEFFRTIQERLRYDNIPIIVMTALARKAWFDELEAEGAVIIQKPFNVHELVSLVDMYVTE